MASWVDSLRSMIDGTIEEEDRDAFNQEKSELSPLQSHIGTLKSKPQPLFHTLPNELKSHIFSFLPAEDLITSVCFVCREWNRYVEDELSWRDRFERDIGSWNVFGTSNYLAMFSTAPLSPKNKKNNHNNNSSSNNNNNIVIQENNSENINNNSVKAEEESKEELTNSKQCEKLLPTNSTWKNWYMIQYVQNNRSFRGPERALKKIIASSSSKFSFLSKLKGKDKIKEGDQFRIPLFGWGLRNSARGLIYRLMWSKESPLTLNNLYPGVEGIGSGIGFKVNNKLLNLAAVYGDCTELKDWPQFLKGADGLIFVIDAITTDEHFDKVVEQFNTVAPYSIPLLILACYDSLSTDNLLQHEIEAPEDPEDETNGKRRSLLEIALKLKVDQFNGSRHWSIRNVTSLLDFCQGLDWLSQA